MGLHLDHQAQCSLDMLIFVDKVCWTEFIDSVLLNIYNGVILVVGLIKDKAIQM